MNLRQFCSRFKNNTLIDILVGTLSTGAYSVEEILSGKINNNLLDSPMEEGATTIAQDIADNLIANDSNMHNEFFQKDTLLPYIAVSMK